MTRLSRVMPFNVNILLKVGRAVPQSYDVIRCSRKLPHAAVFM